MPLALTDTFLFLVVENDPLKVAFRTADHDTLYFPIPPEAGSRGAEALEILRQIYRGDGFRDQDGEPLEIRFIRFPSHIQSLEDLEVNPFAYNVLEVSDDKLQQVFDWAVPNFERAALNDSVIYDGDRTKSTRLFRLSQTYRSFVYNLVLIALNPLNRSDPDRWDLISQSMRGWHSFTKLVDDETLLIFSIGLHPLYDHNKVWLWHESSPRSLVNVRQVGESGIPDVIAEGFDDAAVPLGGLPADHFTVRELLGIPHYYEVHDTSLVDVVVTDGDGNEILLDPPYSNDILEYSVDIPEDELVVNVDASAEYEHAGIEVEMDPLDDSTPEIIIVVTSQDRESVRRIRVSVNKVQ